MVLVLNKVASKDEGPYLRYPQAVVKQFVDLPDIDAIDIALLLNSDINWNLDGSEVKTNEYDLRCIKC
jgi:hypothetical protein